MGRASLYNSGNTPLRAVIRDGSFAISPRLRRKYASQDAGRVAAVRRKDAAQDAGRIAAVRSTVRKRVGG
jgi:hypothetical protein